jgi:Peptidase A4 family
MGRVVTVFAAVFAGLLASTSAWASSAAQIPPRPAESLLIPAAHVESARSLISASVTLPAAVLANAHLVNSRLQGRVAVTASPRRRPRARLSVSPANLTYSGGNTTIAWSSANATLCTLSASPAFWSGANPARVRCHGRMSFTLPVVAGSQHWRFTLTARRGIRAATARRSLSMQAPPFATSTNWSGYAIQPSVPVTEVSGQFTVPTLNCADITDASEAMWVGIGGDGPSTGDLLQTGVESTCAAGVQVENPGWWEEFPEYFSVNFNSMVVSPGDQISASVYQAADGSWVTKVDDLTKGVSGVMQTGVGWGTILDASPTSWLVEEGDASTVSYAGGSSAEWILEDYGTGANGTPVPFADFGTVRFENLTTNLSSWNLTSDEAIGLRDPSGSGLLLAAPSAPDPSNGFSIAYTG